MDCIFCRIVAGEIPANVVARSANAMAFHDVGPQAPTHILVIPTRHVASTAHVAPAERAATFGDVIALATQVAADVGLADAGYRMVINTGKDAGQSVDHLHVHLLGGRKMTWPPG